MKKLMKGFTMVELLIYMGLLSILIGILSTIFVSIINTQLESSATSSVEQDGRYILARLIYDTQSAQQIVAPTIPGSPSATLQIRVNSIDYTYSLNNGNLQIASSSATNVLNSANTSVSGLSFQRLGNGDNNDTIRLNFTVTSKTKRSGNTENRSFQTTLGLQ
jgi:type II secretory pathway pseudopilin PulG